MNVLILAHTALGSNYKVGSHHLHDELISAGHEVRYLSYKRVDGRTTISSYLCFICAFLRYRISYSPNVVLIDSVLYFIISPFFSNRAIYRVTDNYGARSITVKLLERIFFKRFRVIVTHPKLGEIYSSRGFNILGCVQNGVPAFMFKTNIAYGDIRLDRNSQMNFFYVGALDDRFCVKCIKQLSIDFPKSVVHIVGSGEKVSELNTLTQVKYYGELNYNGWRPIAMNSQFAILPFEDSLLNRTRSPMKLYEFFAFGLPVISWIDNIHPRALKYSKFKNTIIDYSSSYRLDLSNMAQKQSWSHKTQQYLRLILK